MRSALLSPTRRMHCNNSIAVQQLAIIQCYSAVGFNINMFIFTAAIVYAVPTPPFAVQEEITLPPGIGDVYEMMKVDLHTILAATLTVKLLINITEDKIIKRWDEIDPYPIHRPFFALLYTHGQYFSFKKLNSLNTVEVFYRWWGITESVYDSTPNLVIHFPHCCSLTKNTGGSATLRMFSNGATYSGNYLAMFFYGVPVPMVALATSTGVNFYKVATLATSNTQFANLYSGVYTRIKMGHNAVYRFMGERLDGNIKFGDMNDIGDAPSHPVLNFPSTVPGGRLLDRSQNSGSWYFSQGMNLGNVGITNILGFNITMDMQVLSLVENKDFFNQEFLVVGGANRIKVLKTCFFMCASCSGAAQYQCLSCSPTYTYDSGTCSNSSCSTTQYSYGGGNCLTCTTGGAKCGWVNAVEVHYTCLAGNYLFVDKCQTACPRHSQILGSQCKWKNCPLGQNKFLSSETCVVCPSGYYIFLLDGSCQLCGGICVTCFFPGYCLSCFAPLFAYLGLCLNTCPSLTEGDSILGICVPCPHFYYSIGSHCVDTCLSTDYPDSQGYCQSCIAPCASCTGPSYCLSCLNLLQQQGTCTSQCTGRYYQVGNSCVYCSNFLQATTQQCLLTCPQGTFANTGTLECSPCVPPCYMCSSASLCTGCNGEFLHSGTCLNPCPATFFGDLITNTCLPCKANCSNCTGPSNCQQCVSPMFLLNDNCFTSCPLSYFSNFTHCLLCSTYCVELTYQKLSQNNQPYSNLFVAMNFSKPVDLAAVNSSLILLHSGNVELASFSQASAQNLVLEFRPANPDFSLTNEPVKVRLDDNGVRARNNYKFLDSAYHPALFNFSFLPIRNSATAKLTLALADLNAAVFRMPVNARCALNFLLLDQNSLLAVKSNVNLPKHYVMLQNLLHSGNFQQPRDWLWKTNSSSRRLLFLSPPAVERLVFRTTLFVCLGGAVLLLVGIELLKWQGMVGRQSVGLHWAVSDFIHRMTAVLLLSDLASLAESGKVLDSVVQLAVVGYIYLYFQYRLRRFIKLSRTCYYQPGFEPLFREFEFELVTFKYVPRVEMTMCSYFVHTFLGPLYFISCLLLYFVKATFYLNLSGQPDLLFGSILILNFLHFAALVINRPFLNPLHNIAAVVILAIQNMLEIAWLVFAVVYKQPQTSSSLAFEVLGWVSLLLTVSRLLTQLAFMAMLNFAYLSQISKSYENHCLRVRLYCEKQAADKTKSTHILNKWIVQGNLNDYRESLKPAMMPLLLIRFKDNGNLYVRRTSAVRMNRKHFFVSDENNLKISEVKDRVVDLKHQPIIESLLGKLVARFPLQDEQLLMLQVVFQQQLDQKKVDFGCSVSLPNKFREAVLVLQSTRRIRKIVEKKQNYILEHLFKKFYICQTLL